MWRSKFFQYLNPSYDEIRRNAVYLENIPPILKDSSLEERHGERNIIGAILPVEDEVSVEYQLSTVLVAH